MHNIFIRMHKALAKQWMKLPFVAIFTVLETWPLEWHAIDLAEFEKAATQRKKDDAKLRITQLGEKRRKEAVAIEVWAAWDVTQKATE